MRANSPTNSDTITSPAPQAVIQKLKLLRNGKATSRAPICSGIDEVHEPGDERHRDEEDHDDAVRGEDLVVVVRRQVARRLAEGDGLLSAHHDGVGEAAQQHHQAQDHVHDADLLVVDAGDPVAPQRAPQPEVGERADDGDAAEHDPGEGGEQDRVVQRNRLPGEAAEERAW